MIEYITDTNEIPGLPIKTTTPATTDVPTTTISAGHVAVISVPTSL